MRRGEQETQIKRCPVCGEEFLGQARQKYCGKRCAKEVRDSKRPPASPGKPPKPKDKSLAAVALAATKAGMSYGKYVAMMERKFH